MYKLLIFDLDGTLLDTIHDLANSVNFALEHFNFPTHNTDEYRFFIGNGVNILLERALPAHKRSADDIAMLKVEFIRHYNAHSDDFTQAYHGINSLLNKLYDANYKLAIASNKFHAATIDLATRFFPEIVFSDVFGQREGHAPKPNPAILNEIITNAGVEKSEVLYIGDSGVDVATAYNAGVDFVGVLWGFRPQKELEEVGAKHFVTNTDELYQFIIKKL
ncbi:MAG: HAD family hydrolase [Paludibacter sp.]